MNEEEFCEYLSERFWHCSDVCGEEFPEEDPIVEQIRDIQEDGFLTEDKGMVVYLSNGERFYLTVHKIPERTGV